MNQNDIMHLLYEYCRQLRFYDVRRIIEKHKSLIDLTHNDNEAFTIAVSLQSQELMNILLDFYTLTQLSSEKSTAEYLEKYSNLQNILVELQESYDLSSELQLIFDKYHIYQISELSNSEIKTTISKGAEELDLVDDIADEIDTKDTAFSLERHLIKSLLLSEENLIARSYQYCYLNKEAEKAHAENRKGECLSYIKRAAELVLTNPHVKANIEYKSLVLYNYLKFTEQNITMLSDRLSNKVLEHIKDHYSYNALLIAIQDSNAPLVDWFLNTQPSLASITDIHGQTILHWAVGQKDNEITKKIITIMNPSDVVKKAEGNDDITALDIAVYNGNHDIIDILQLKGRTLSHEPVTSDEDSHSSAHSIDELVKSLDVFPLGTHAYVKHDEIELSGEISNHF